MKEKFESLVLATIAYNKKHPESASQLDIDNPNLEPELRSYWIAFEDSCKCLGIDIESEKIHSV